MSHRNPFIDWEKWLPLLGVESDLSLAKKIGCTRSAVIYMRRTRGIPAAKSKTNPRKWTDFAISLLGTDADEVIASRLKMTTQCVSLARRKRGIPAAFPDRDNRVAERMIPSTRDREIAAAVRRARLHFTEDQVRYIFGPLLPRNPDAT